jgi:hypothetical protein
MPPPSTARPTTDRAIRASRRFFPRGFASGSAPGVPSGVSGGNGSRGNGSPPPDPGLPSPISACDVPGIPIGKLYLISIDFHIFTILLRHQHINIDIYK